MSKHGGNRKGSGRKPKIEELELIEKLKPLEPLAYEALKQGLADQDYRFVQLYLNYYYGKPKETKDITINEDLPLFVD
tara:strand:- start:1045 stop:1278 length:234 start_codon:yes stop_codon:yes gene_type:complete